MSSEYYFKIFIQNDKYFHLKTILFLQTLQSMGCVICLSKMKYWSCIGVCRVSRLIWILTVYINECVVYAVLDLFSGLSLSFSHVISYSTLVFGLERAHYLLIKQSLNSLVIVSVSPQIIHWRSVIYFRRLRALSAIQDIQVKCA